MAQQPGCKPEYLKTCCFVWQIVQCHIRRMTSESTAATYTEDISIKQRINSGKLSLTFWTAEPVRCPTRIIRENTESCTRGQRHVVELLMLQDVARTRWDITYIGSSPNQDMREALKRLC